eukprot:sb/3465734/
MSVSKQPIRTRYLGYVTGYHVDGHHYARYERGYCDGYVFRVRYIKNCISGTRTITLALSENGRSYYFHESTNVKTLPTTNTINADISKTNDAKGHHLKLTYPVSASGSETTKQPIRNLYLGHVTSYQPIGDQYFLIRSVPATTCSLHFIRLGELTIAWSCTFIFGHFFPARLDAEGIHPDANLLLDLPEPTIQSFIGRDLQLHIIMLAMEFNPTLCCGIGKGFNTLHKLPLIIKHGSEPERDGALSNCNGELQTGRELSTLTKVTLLQNSQKLENNQSNQNSLFRSRDWLSANLRPVFPDSIGSCHHMLQIKSLFQLAVALDSSRKADSEKFCTRFGHRDFANLVWYEITRPVVHIIIIIIILSFVYRHRHDRAR